MLTQLHANCSAYGVSFISDHHSTEEEDMQTRQQALVIHLGSSVVHTCAHWQSCASITATL